MKRLGMLVILDSGLTKGVRDETSPFLDHAKVSFRVDLENYLHSLFFPFGQVCSN